MDRTHGDGWDAKKHKLVDSTVSWPDLDVSRKSACGHALVFTKSVSDVSDRFLVAALLGR